MSRSALVYEMPRLLAPERQQRLCVAGGGRRRVALPGQAEPGLRSAMVRGQQPQELPPIPHQYARDVLAGKIPVCSRVRQTCSRHLDDLDRTGDACWPYAVDAAKGDRVCRFVGRSAEVRAKFVEANSLEEAHIE